MKYFLLPLTFLFNFTFTQGQTTVFSDDFENGLSEWVLTGEWDTTTTEAFNGSYSLTDSPNGLYLSQQTTYATLADSIDLTGILDANIHMKVKYDIENGFDYCYIDMSSNNGSSWTPIYTFNGQNNLASWTDITVSAGGFVGSNQAKFRFRFFTDQAFEADGIYIDSFRIVTDTIDNSAPLIVHNPDPHYEGQLDTNFRAAQINDVSGVAATTLTYTVDNGTPQVITPFNNVVNTYEYAVPPQSPGSYVDYTIYAIDSSPQMNAITSEDYSYIAGNYINHDNGVVDAVDNFTSVGFYTGVANRITLDGLSTLTTALIRNYTDINNPNDSIEFHVWDVDTNNMPGNDLIEPFNVYPEAALLDPQAMTRIDLRSYSSSLDSLVGDIYIGFIMQTGSAWVCQSTGSNGRGVRLGGGNWSSSTATYHIRAITTEPANPPESMFTWDGVNDPTIQFTDQSTSTPNAWWWDLGDGDSAFVQHPNHTYAESGSYNVCLTAGNSLGIGTTFCDLVTVNNGPPEAQFIVNVSNDPKVELADISQNNPTSWDWDFGDGNTSTLQHPEHTYDSPDNYSICLIASNQYGSDTSCQNITVNNRLPIPLFTHEALGDNKIKFENLTGPGIPSATYYQWSFGYNNDSSIAKDPIYQYPETGGTFNVCLVASNTVGSSDPYCADLELRDLTTGISTPGQRQVVLFPNPARDVVRINVNNAAPVTSWRLVTMDGKTVKQSDDVPSQGVSIDVSELPSGIYLVEVDQGSNRTKLTLVVE